MKCFRWRCYVNNSFLVFHQGTKHSKTIKHSRFALVFHTVFSCLDPLMKHSNSLFTYNVNTACLKRQQAYFAASLVQTPTRIREMLIPAHIFHLRKFACLIVYKVTMQQLSKTQVVFPVFHV